jgi:DNA invertase Pin-like site-specific DNA recombinase
MGHSTYSYQEGPRLATRASSRVVVAVNERGRRIGETHHNAVVSDVLVDQIRERHEDDGLGYRRIAQELHVALTTVRKICTYQRRAQTPERWKTIKVRKAMSTDWIPVSLNTSPIKSM